MVCPLYLYYANDIGKSDGREIDQIIYEGKRGCETFSPNCPLIQNFFKFWHYVPYFLIQENDLSLNFAQKMDNVPYKGVPYKTYCVYMPDPLS